jgi:hypothetical protein
MNPPFAGQPNEGVCRLFCKFVTTRSEPGPTVSWCRGLGIMGHQGCFFRRAGHVFLVHGWLFWAHQKVKPVS